MTLFFTKYRNEVIVGCLVYLALLIKDWVPVLLRHPQ